MKIIHSARKADPQNIHDRLYAYNCSKTGETPKKIVLPDEPAMHSFIIPAEHSDEILGGLVYHVKESACKVDFLWVSETLRGQGAGMKLLDLIKLKAAELGCREITLFTMSFQAPGFYPKAGFVLTHTKEDKSLTAYYYRYEIR